MILKSFINRFKDNYMKGAFYVQCKIFDRELPWHNLIANSALLTGYVREYNRFTLHGNHKQMNEENERVE